MGGVLVGGDLIESNLFCAVSHTVRIEKEREMTRNVPCPCNRENRITSISLEIEKKSIPKFTIRSKYFEGKDIAAPHVTIKYNIK